MAENILSDCKNKKTLVIAGRYHTQLNRQGSMANFVSQQANFAKVELEYLSGKFHNFGSREFTSSEKLASNNNIQFKSDKSNNQFKFIIPRADKVEIF